MSQYKVQDTITGKIYTFEGNYDSPPTDEEIEDTLYGTITATKPTLMDKVHKFEKATLGEEAYKSLDTEASKLLQTAVQAPTQWASRQLSRPTSAITALEKGEDPIKGWVNPEQYQEPSAGIIPIEEWNKTLKKVGWKIEPGEQEFWTRALAGFAADLGKIHLVYGVVPKVAGEQYGKAQTTELKKFKKALFNEFKQAGMSEGSAAVSAEGVGTEMFKKSRMLQRTPWNIAKSTASLEKNSGKLAQMMREWGGMAKAKVDQLGYTNWADKAGQELEQYEGWLKSREPTQRPELNVPLHPAPAIVEKVSTGVRQKAEYEGWLKSREPTIRPELNVPLHPAPATSIDYTKLAYPSVPKTVAKTLPDEVIQSPTEEEVTKTVSRFPQKVTDQKSLEEVGNAMAKEMGVTQPIVWKYKLYDKDYVTGQFASLRDKTKPFEILIRIPKEKLGRVEVMEQLEKPTYIAGSRGKLPHAVLQPTQGKIKKVILHELGHALHPGESHTTIFWDDVEKHEANTLIKKELVKRQVQPPTPEPEKALVQTEHYAGYKHPEGVQVVDATGEEIEVFESEVAAKRWIDSAEKDYLAKPEIDPLVENPDLADQILANPKGRTPEEIEFAREIKRDYPDKEKPKPVSKKEPETKPPAESPPDRPIEKELPKNEASLYAKETGTYKPNSIYQVSYSSPIGNRMTMMFGRELNKMEDELATNPKPLDKEGRPVYKILDAFEDKSQSGQLNIRIALAPFEGFRNIVDTVETRINHPTGKQVLEDIKYILTKDQIDVSDHLHGVNFFRGKHDEIEAKMVSDIIEGKPVTFVNEAQRTRLTTLAAQCEVETGKVMERAVSLGVKEKIKTTEGATRWIPIRKVGHYIPRMVSPEARQALAGGLDSLHAAIADLRNSGKELTLENLKALAEKVGGKYSHLTRAIEWVQTQGLRTDPHTIIQILDGTVNKQYGIPYGHLERPRTAVAELPPEFYERRIDVVLTDYFRKASHRLNEIEVFGQQNEKFLPKLEELAVEAPEEAQIIKKLVEDYHSKGGHKVAENIGLLLSIAKVGLGTSTIPNLFQLLISTIPKQGVFNFLKGGLQLATSSESRRLLGRTGLPYGDIVYALLGYQREGLLWKANDFLLKYNQFKSINRVNALLSASSTNAWIQDKLLPKTQSSNAKTKEWAYYQLGRLGIKPEDVVNGSISEDKMVYGMLRGAMDTQLFSDITKEPMWLSDPRNRWAAILKRFGVKQGIYAVHNIIYDEMKFGNPIPFLRLIAGGLLGGAGSMWALRKLWDLGAFVKEKVTDKTPTPPDWYNNFSDPDKATYLQYVDMLAQAGTMGFITDLMRTDREGKWSFRAMEFAATPAVFSDAEMIKRIGDALLKGEEAWGRGAPRGAKRYLDLRERMLKAWRQGQRLFPASKLFMEGE